MTPERWQRIEDLYHAALKRAPGERVALLKEACADDEALRREVEALLSANEQAGGFLQDNALAVQAAALANEVKTAPAVPDFSHYQIVTRIGAGGMGEVWLARDTTLDRKVALKLLPVQFTADADRLRRFVREAKAASALNHPNIITIYEIGQLKTEAGPTHYIATEFIQGVTLRERLAGEKLPLPEALKIALQITAALAAAHEAGIVHRDIKPENVMIRPDGLVKVLDFGLAKLTERRAVEIDNDASTIEIDATKPGVVMGTARYMSPEQARGLDVDARSDVFSLGCVLYEMIAGRTPFNGATLADLIAALLEREPEPLTQLAPDTPIELERFITKALAKDRQLRYQTIKDLQIDLQTLKDASDLGAELRRPNQPGTRALPVANATRAGWFNTSARFKWWGAAGAVALATLFIAGLLYNLIRRSTPHSVAPLQTIPLTTLPGRESEPSFSPDGNQIAFVWKRDRSDNQDIYVKQIGNEMLVRLTTSPAPDRGPAWSPDGRWIAFTRRGSDEIGLYVIPSLGGAERKIAALAPTLLPEFPVPLSWTPDSEWLAVPDKSAPQESYGIWLVARETGEKRRLTTPQTNGGDGQPTVSPDGKTVLFTRDHNLDLRDLYLIPITGGNPQQVVFDQETSVSQPSWTPDGRAILFISNRDSGRGGLNNLWRVPVAGGTPLKVAAVSEALSNFVLSRQGNRLAWAQSLDDTNIWRLELDATGKPKTAPHQLIASTRMEVDARFSPDGSKIAFASNRSGSWQIWVAESTGERPVPLTSFNGPLAGSSRWSPDGRLIAFDFRTAGNPDIHVISAEGGKPRRLTTEPTIEALPSWSRDGVWIYFCSDCNSSNQQIWKMPAAGGQALQVTQQGGFDNVESPDGQYLYFTKGYRVPGIWRMPVAGGEETLVLKHHSAGQWRYWAVKEQGIYFATAETPERPLLEFFSFATGKATPLATLEKKISYFGFAGLDVSPDGRWLIWQQLDQEGSDIMLMENFRWQ